MMKREELELLKKKPVTCEECLFEDTKERRDMQMGWMGRKSGG